MTERNAIEARNVVKTFGQGDTAVKALDDVSVEIREGEFFTLLGPSGCGKTTLLRLIAGFEMPTDGLILLDGQDITYLPPNKRPVNTVFQSYALFPHLTVAQNISFGLEMLGKPAAEVKARTAEMLAWSSLTRWRTARPASFRAASSSAWRWRAPWPRSPKCFCWMNPCRPWISNCGKRCKSS